MTRVSVIGAAGLSGGELIRLVHQHPGLDLVHLGGHRHAGQRLSAVHPGLRLRPDPLIEKVTDDLAARRCDAVLLATPAPVSARLAPRLSRTGAVVVDLSGAFRLRSAAAHARWYPDADRPPGLVDHFVHGVPELVRDQLPQAALIALPGCYATAATLAVAPLVLGMDLCPRRLLIDAKGGSSGGGLTGRTADAHPYRDGNITPYAPAGHRHAAEIEEFFGRRTTEGPRVSMSAYGTGGVRGLLVSCYAFTELGGDSDAADAADAGDRTLLRAYIRFYRDHPFVRFRRQGETAIPVPSPKAVNGSNYCDVSAVHDPDGERVIALAALDNLIKGAAGQAVQALNLRFGYAEDTGLAMLPVVPV
ncbi:N-acetyl-gamma-glutamyl-phosphate reductase [Streptomyces sp. NPDC053474]|uniref:N-acetyl-gamma-glutamyl-phosphate reductase n=1 Tax=Streptomyces sp. NPDC053474 TaxID=3365704 RepID=UPI0037D527FF